MDDQNSNSEKPRKISLDEVEVIDQSGQVLREGNHSSEAQSNPFFGAAMGGGQFKVMKAGPFALLLIPILLPFILIGFVLLFFLAMLMGRSVFRVFRPKQ